VEYDADDLRSVALTAWKEARGDGDMAMRAVMHVIKNRVGASGFAHDIHGVVFGKNQFSSMSVVGDPEFNLDPEDDHVSPLDYQAYLYCREVVESVLNGTDADLTNGAKYYDNPKTATSGWFARAIVSDPINHPLVATIGKQNFYK
jgi:spore germination cell wall hydrolase CwlJ-like protein